MTCVGCVHIVSMVVVQKLVRAFRHSPCIIGQFCVGLSVCLGVVAGVAHQVITFQAGVIDDIIPAVHAAAVSCLSIVDTDIQTIVAVGRFVALPVGTFYQMVGFIIDVLSGFLLAGFCDAVSTLVTAVGIALVTLFTAHQLVQLIVSVDASRPY